MRSRTDLHQSEAAIEFVPVSIIERLNFREIFGRDAPVEVDLGCGEGTFLVAMAAQNPDRNFLGIERLRGRVRSVCRKIARLNLENVRILRMESSYAVAHLLPENAISAFHVLFPDPWPKRRHHRRRLFTAEFFGAMDRALDWNGLLHLATDDVDYFRSIYKMITTKPSFSICEEPIDFPMTAFEQKLATNGASIQRLLLRKVSPVR
jgi:tRNA (guanine-N7-)-methyltransferase